MFLDNICTCLNIFCRRSLNFRMLQNVSGLFHQNQKERHGKSHFSPESSGDFAVVVQNLSQRPEVNLVCRKLQSLFSAEMLPNSADID